MGEEGPQPRGSLPGVSNQLTQNVTLAAKAATVPAAPEWPQNPPAAPKAPSHPLA